MEAGFLFYGTLDGASLDMEKRKIFVSAINETIIPCHPFSTLVSILMHPCWPYVGLYFTKKIFQIC
jgi:hypothetical protein